MRFRRGAGPTLTACLRSAIDGTDGIRNLASLSELSLPATDAAHDRASAEMPAPLTPEHHINAAEAADANAAMHPDADPRRLHHNHARRTIHILKPLIVLATAQYVIVTLLAGLGAIMIASQAGKAINTKLEPIIAALKRI